MKILFGVQTEGNGHITQAIAIKQYLNQNGYEVSKAFAASKKRGLSKYFTDEFDVVTYEGFDFVFDNVGRVVIWKTILKNTLEFPRLILSFIKICNIIRKEKPDAIFNYYEPLVGLTALFFRKIKYVSFGHQYAMESPIYPNVSGYPVQKLFLGIINKITSIRAKIVALSYYEFNDADMIVSPPILRSESYGVSDKQEDFVLVYLMNEDMLHQLFSEAKKYPDIKIECFTKLTKQHDELPNVKLYNLDGKLFQEKMKVCKSVICSGGFETSAEAIYQNKPLLMIPMPNHYEQHANCEDAYLQSLALYCEKIDLSKIPTFQTGNKKWFDTRQYVLQRVLYYLGVNR
jgi:uncharacterized protein (TIGR00661 family)